MADENKQTEAAKPSTVKLVAPEGASGVTVHGAEYEAVDGFVEVPPEAVAVLQSHGYCVPKSGKKGG